MKAVAPNFYKNRDQIITLDFPNQRGIGFAFLNKFQINQHYLEFEVINLCQRGPF